MRKTALLLVLSLLVVGCVDVNVQQKVYRDGTADLSLTFVGSEQVLSGFRNMKPVESFKDKMTFSETEGSITYSFSKVPLGANLFELEPGKDTSFFGIEKATVADEGGFFSHKYVYSLNPGSALPADQGEQAKAMMSAIKINYRVEVFGKVKETSGTKVDDHTIDFVIDPTSTVPHTIAFSEPFWSSWFD